MSRRTIYILLLLLHAVKSVYPDNYASWSYYKSIQLNTTSTGANVTSMEIDFPVLIRLNPGVSDLDFSSIRDSGQDIRFGRLVNGTVKHLPYEIERWTRTDGNDTAEIWVLVDTLKGNDSTEIRMYYGRISAIDSSNSALVFDTSKGFLGVYHFAPSDTFGDATLFNNDGTNSGTVSGDGMVNNGRYFNSSNSSYISYDTTTLQDSITLSVWAKPNSGPSSIIDLFASAGSGATSNGYKLYLNTYNTSDGKIIFETGNGSWTSQSLTNAGQISYTAPTSWYYIALTLKRNVSGSELIYRNGQDVTVTKQHITDFGNSLTWRLGRYNNSTDFPFPGYMDEARLEKKIRSPGWVRLCYINQRALINNQDSLVCWRGSSFQPQTEGKHWRGTTNYWNTASNWRENTVPANGDTIVFDSTTSTYTTKNNITGLNNMHIHVDGAGGDVSIDSLGFALGAHGIDMSAALVNLSIHVPLTISANQTWSVCTGRRLFIDSSISLNSYYLTFSEGGTDSITGSIKSGTGGLVMNGSGTLYLNGNNTYTGKDSISAGYVYVNNTSGYGLGTGSDTAQVTGGTLGGTGYIYESVKVTGGTISPGFNGCGILTTGSLVMGSGTVFSASVTNTTTLTMLAVKGSVTLGNATLSFNLLGTPQKGETYRIIDNDGADAIDGTFNGIAEGATVLSSYNGTGYSFTITYIGGTGNDAVITCQGPTVSAVIQQPASTSNGLQSFGANGFGIPNAAIIYMARATVNGTAVTETGLGFGATDGTRQFTVSAASMNGQTRSKGDNLGKVGRAISLVNPATHVIECEASFSSFKTDSLVINWNSAPSSAYVVTAVLLRVDNAYVDTFTSSGTLNNSVALTTGFRPDQVILFSNRNNFSGTIAQPQQLSIGFCDTTNGSRT